MKAADVKIGDKVKMTDGPRGAPVGDGQVVKIGRAWVTVGSEYGVERRFRLDDQTDGSRYSTRCRFYTLDQWAKREARNAALKLLREQDIWVGLDSVWHGREIELANLIKGASGE